MSDYENRQQAITDATRLVRDMTHGPERAYLQGFADVSSQPTVELFDVLEVARFLLGIDASQDGPA